LVARQINELAHPGQRMRQARHRGAGQPAATGNFQVTEPRLMTLEAAQNIECARHNRYNITPPRNIAGAHSWFAYTLRASSNERPIHSAMRNEIPLATQPTSANP